MLADAGHADPSAGVSVGQDGLGTARRTVLLLTAHFPPRMSPGVFRALRFARFLPQQGWDCVVVSLKDGCCRQRDDRLVAQIPATAEVHNICCGCVAEHLHLRKRDWRGFGGGVARPVLQWLGDVLADVCVPDKWVTGVKGLCRAVARIAGRRRIDAVWITGPPYSWFLAGPWIRRRLGIPVVLDLRDPWTPDRARNTALMRRWRRPIERRMEQRVFQAADRVILNTPGALAHYRALYARLPADRWAVVTNSFEPSDMAHVEPEQFGRWTLVHGGLTSSRRTSIYLFEALGQLKRRGVLSADTFRYVSYGGMCPEEAEAVRRLAIDDLVEFRGSRSHSEVLAAVGGASGLLLLVAAGHELNIPGKLYEYLAVNRPILLAGPRDCDAADVIRRTHSGSAIELTDVAGYVRFLSHWLETGSAQLHASEAAVTEYSSAAVSAKLAGLLSEVVARESGSRVGPPTCG